MKNSRGILWIEESAKCVNVKNKEMTYLGIVQTLLWTRTPAINRSVFNVSVYNAL